MHKVLIPYLLALCITPSTHSLEGTLLVCWLYLMLPFKLLSFLNWKFWFLDGYLGISHNIWCAHINHGSQNCYLCLGTWEVQIVIFSARKIVGAKFVLSLHFLPLNNPRNLFEESKFLSSRISYWPDSAASNMRCGVRRVILDAPNHGYRKSRTWILCYYEDFLFWNFKLSTTVHSTPSGLFLAWLVENLKFILGRQIIIQILLMIFVILIDACEFYHFKRLYSAISYM